VLLSDVAVQTFVEFSFFFIFIYLSPEGSDYSFLSCFLACDRANLTHTTQHLNCGDGGPCPPLFIFPKPSPPPPKRL
jgi:hypothetical protein